MEKVLVLFVFHIYNDRVKAFLSNALFYDTHTDFVIISNDKDAKVNIPSNTLTNVRVIYRDNIGYDFGGWSDALLQNNLYMKYDRFIFVNSSVSGPFLPAGYRGKWTDIYLDGLQGNIKLFGSTINTIKDPLHSSHVQSYIFAMDKDTLEYLIDSEIFSTTAYAKDFQEAIVKKEMLMSRKILENNWNIGSLLKLYKGVDFTFKTKRPEDYSIEFMDDIMFDSYRNVLWKDHELVFIKGNRVNSKEGFRDLGSNWLLMILIFFAFAFAFAKFSMIYATGSFRRIHAFFRRAARSMV